MSARSRSPSRSTSPSASSRRRYGGTPRSRSRSRSRSRPRRRSRSRSRSSTSSPSQSPPRRRTRSPFSSSSPTPGDGDLPLRQRSRRGRAGDSQSPSPSPSPSSPPPQQLPLSPQHQHQHQPPQPPVRPEFRPGIVLHGHAGPVSQVRISPNGRWIASASADGTLKLWDAATGDHMDTLVGHMAGVSCLAWSPDGGTIASGSDDKAIRLWDRVTGRPKMSAKGQVPPAHAKVESAVVSPMAPLMGHHSYIHCLAFSPKGNILASGSYDEAVFLWDVRAGRLMRSLPAHSDPVSGIDFCRDGTLVVSCSTDGLIRVWDTSTGQCLRTLVHEDNPAVANVCFSPNGRFVLASSLDNCLRLWDYVSGAVKKTYQGHVNEKFAVGGCFGSCRGEPFVASASENGQIILWDVGGKGVVQAIQAHQGVCFWVDVCADIMVSAGQDKTVRIFRNVAAGSERILTWETSARRSPAQPLSGDASPSPVQVKEEDGDIDMTAGAEP